MGRPGGSSTSGPRCSVEGEADMAVKGVDITLFWRQGPVQTDHDVQRVATHAAWALGAQAEVATQGGVPKMPRTPADRGGHVHNH